MLPDNMRYKICFVLDKSSMFRIISSMTAADGSSSELKHSVKPLELLWAKVRAFPIVTSTVFICESIGLCVQVPEWNIHNTLHVDDLSRNFALNPRNGIKCSAWYRDSAETSASSVTSSYGSEDTELLLLSKYLCHVATEPSAAPSTTGKGGAAQLATASSRSTGVLAWDHSKWREVALSIAIASNFIGDSGGSRP